MRNKNISPNRSLFTAGLLFVLGGCLAVALAFNSCSRSPGKTADSKEVAGDGSGSSPELEVVEKTDPYGNTERYSRRLDDYAKEGPYSLISPEGAIIETANYYNDTLHGLRILYYETGDTQIVERYENGAFSGLYQAYYPNGTLELEGSYTANVMEGDWKRYYKNGQLMEKVQFQDNQENGPFTEYFENGQLKAEGYYKDGDNEHGLLKIYNEEGTLTKTMHCQQGVCRTVWELGREGSN